MKPFCKILSVCFGDKPYIEIVSTPKQSEKLKRLLLLSNIENKESKIKYTSNPSFKCYIKTKEKLHRTITFLKKWDSRYNILTDCDKLLKKYLDVLNEKDSIT